jgi:hypothetical protein
MARLLILCLLAYFVKVGFKNTELIDWTGNQQGHLAVQSVTSKTGFV